MKFRIPDFPLGALLIVILFSVGLLFTYAEVPFAWEWQIVAAVSVLLWILGAGVLDFSKPDEIARLKEEKKRGDEEQAGQTPDFLALIEAECQTQQRQHLHQTHRLPVVQTHQAAGVLV